MDKPGPDPGKRPPASWSGKAASIRWRELMKDVQGSRFPNSHPRDAATLIVIDMAGGKPRLLMGQRHHKLKFMPGKFVFPGGRVEASDYLATVGCRMPAPLTAKLLRGMKGPQHRQRALALAHAALRETREETGIVIGGGADGAGAQGGGRPDFSGLVFLARAITPPRRPRRFDTRFFAVGADRIAERGPVVDGEFIAIEWFTLEEARRQDLADITRMILSDLEERLSGGGLCDAEAAVPFYFMRGACFHRKLL